MSTLALLAIRLPPNYALKKRVLDDLRASLNTPPLHDDTPKEERRRERSAEYRSGSGRA